MELKTECRSWRHAAALRFQPPRPSSSIPSMAIRLLGPALVIAQIYLLQYIGSNSFYSKASLNMPCDPLVEMVNRLSRLRSLPEAMIRCDKMFIAKFLSDQPGRMYSRYCMNKSVFMSLLNLQCLDILVSLLQHPEVDFIINQVVWEEV